MPRDHELPCPDRRRRRGLFAFATLALTLSTSACPAASEGTWTASVASVSESGAPPEALATTYAVVATVEGVAGGGAGECGVSFQIEGLGDGGVAGGAGCDDDSFEGFAAGDSLDVSVPEIESIRVGVEGTLMTMTVQGKSPDWERVYEGAATHTPPP